MAKKLTAAQRHLLRFPPTETTWICPAWTIVRPIEGPETPFERCKTINSGQRDVCWMCRARKPRRPKLLWPEYLETCQIAGHEPGTPYPPRKTQEGDVQPATRRAPRPTTRPPTTKGQTA